MSNKEDRAYCPGGPPDTERGLMKVRGGGLTLAHQKSHNTTSDFFWRKTQQASEATHPHIKGSRRVLRQLLCIIHQLQDDGSTPKQYLSGEKQSVSKYPHRSALTKHSPEEENSSECLRSEQPKCNNVVVPVLPF